MDNALRTCIDVCVLNICDRCVCVCNPYFMVECMNGHYISLMYICLLCIGQMYGGAI